eukprot:2340691-Prymnesium_polylepis.1
MTLTRGTCGDGGVSTQTRVLGGRSSAIRRSHMYDETSRAARNPRKKVDMLMALAVAEHPECL